MTQSWKPIHQRCQNTVRSQFLKDVEDYWKIKLLRATALLFIEYFPV